MATLLDSIDKRDMIDKCGMNVKLDLPRTGLWDFRIAYKNLCLQTASNGVSVSTGAGIEQYSAEIVQQMTDGGYYIKEVGGIWSEDCYYAYLRAGDADEEYPGMKVYVHPNEMAGWAPKKNIERLLDIADSNSYLSDVRLVYAQKVYRMDNAQYLEILQEAEEQILAWLMAYKKLHGGRIGNAPEAFNRIFGIKRLSAKHLSYRDYVAINYIDRLITEHNI